MLAALWWRIRSCTSLVGANAIDPNLMPDKAFTIEMWYRSFAAENGRTLFAYGTDASSNMWAFYNDDMFWVNVCGAGYPQENTGPVATNDGAWHHVAATWDKDNDHKLLMYVDGVFISDTEGKDGVDRAVGNGVVESFNDGQLGYFEVGGEMVSTPRHSQQLYMCTIRYYIIHCIHL